MRLAFAAGALTAIAVAAQDLSNLPDCGLKCIIDAIPGTGCAVATDFSCVCNAADKLTTPVQVCAGQTCSIADFEALPAALTKFCRAAGVEISVDSALPSTSSSSTSSSAPTSSPAPASASTSASDLALTSSTSSASTTSGSVAPSSVSYSNTSSLASSEIGLSASNTATSASTPSTATSTNAGVDIGINGAQVFLAVTTALVVFAITF